MKRIWVAIRNWIDSQSGIDMVTVHDPWGDDDKLEYVGAGVSIEQGIEDYFSSGDGREVLTTFYRVRAILVGRKMLRRERSDKGLPRGAYRLAPVGKFAADAIASQDRATAVNGGETA